MFVGSYQDNPRWSLAERITEAVRRRFSADVLAVGVRGAVAHGDGTDGGGLELLVITDEPGFGPRPATRRVDGHIVDLDVISADEYLIRARTLSAAWPLAADQYLAAKPTYDPDDWYPAVRDTHLARLAEADPDEFSALAEQAWYRAWTALARGQQLATLDETDAGLIAVADARVGAALVDGLLTRTYFRNEAHAVSRTGVAGMGILDLAERLASQADALGRRGRPVDGSVADLFS